MSWSYAGDTRPACWGNLSREFRLCSEGREQSPIEFRSSEARPAALPALRVEYGTLDLSIEDSGFGFIASPDPDVGEPDRPGISLAERSYRLVQFHAHSPAEHTVDGLRRPLELHFVHEDGDGGVAVVGVLCVEGHESDAWRPFVRAIAGGTESTGHRIEPASVALSEGEALLPATRRYYTYQGSLTTPPCTEGVRWLLLAEPMTLSAGQIDALGRDRAPTNRPVQRLNGRVVEITEQARTAATGLEP